jgi:hypothetical protein
MAEIIDFFAVIGCGATIYFIAKVLDEIIGSYKSDKLAIETARRLREERSRERLEAEWGNMTTAGTEGGMFWRPTGQWVVLTKTNEGNYEAQTCGE